MTANTAVQHSAGARILIQLMRKLAIKRVECPAIPAQNVRVQREQGASMRGMQHARQAV